MFGLTYKINDLFYKFNIFLIYVNLIYSFFFLSI
jgi:hypothetical protein